MHAENRLPALFFVEAEDVGSDRVNLLGTENNIGRAWVRGLPFERLSEDRQCERVAFAWWRELGTLWDRCREGRLVVQRIGREPEYPRTVRSGDGRHRES